MYCKKCGTQLENDSQHCVNCGTAVSVAKLRNVAPVMVQPVASFEAGTTTVENYMTQAVLVTLFCCLPLGAMAFSKSREVNKWLAAGNMNAATAASKAAKNLLIWGVIGGIIIGIILVISNAS